MKFHIETDRLIMREFRMEDAPEILKLNSNPEVVKYLHIPLMKNLEEARADIQFVLNQYPKNNIGRWIMFEKSTGKFMGWSGLKLEDLGVNGFDEYYDVGYRMLPEFWGKGYATESAIASIKYGFEEMKLEKIYGAADVENIGSQKVLQKAGLTEKNVFTFIDFPAIWFEISKEDYFNS